MGVSEVARGKQRAKDINVRDFATEPLEPFQGRDQGDVVPDVVRQIYKARTSKQALGQNESLFKEAKRLNLPREATRDADVLPQPKDEDSFRASIRVVLHALDERMPETIVPRKDPDCRSSVHLRVSRLQTHGAETLKRYLKPTVAAVETSGQNRSRLVKVSEMAKKEAKKLLPSTNSDGFFTTTFVDARGSADQLRKALDKGPVIYDRRESQRDLSIRHIAVLDYRDGTITYADNGNLYQVPDTAFFKYDDPLYGQYSNRVLVEPKQEFPKWKAYQEKLRARLEM